MRALNPKISYSELKKRYISPSPANSTISPDALPSNNSSFKRMPHRSFLSPTPSLRDLKDHMGTFQTIKKEMNQEKHRSQVTKGRVRNLIHACFYFENEDRLEAKAPGAGGGLKDVERDLLIE